MARSTLLSGCSGAAALIFLVLGGLLQAQAPAEPQQQTPPPPSSSIVDTKAFPPRSAPTDYPAHVQVGKFTIGADFTGHNVVTQDGLLTADDYVVIEAGIFGPAGSRLVLSLEDFSVRINNGKRPIPLQPVESLGGKALKDPDYVEPESNKESKTVINSGGNKQDGGDPNAPPPALIPVPFEIRRGYQLRVKRDAMPIGDRSLPQAGLLFFEHNGGTKGIRSIELIYNGPAGKATLPLPLHP